MNDNFMITLHIHYTLNHENQTDLHFILSDYCFEL